MAMTALQKLFKSPPEIRELFFNLKKYIDNPAVVLTSATAPGFPAGLTLVSGPSVNGQIVSLLVGDGVLGTDYWVVVRATNGSQIWEVAGMLLVRSPQEELIEPLV